MNVWPLVLMVGGLGALIVGIVIKEHRLEGRRFALAISLVDSLSPLFPNVPRALALAVIAKESNFLPFAKNLTGKDLARGGAWGFMGMTLATAHTLKVPGLEWDGTGEGLLDPLTNVTMGMAYLSDLLGRFKGDSDLAVAAYNRGRKGVEDAIARGQDIRNDPYVTFVREVKDVFESEGYQ